MTKIKIELSENVVVELTQGEAEALYLELDALFGNFFKNPAQPPIPAILLPRSHCQSLIPILSPFTGFQSSRAWTPPLTFHVGEVLGLE